MHPLPSGLVHVYAVRSHLSGRAPVCLGTLGPGVPASCTMHGSPPHLSSACLNALDPGVGTPSLAPGTLVCLGFLTRGAPCGLLEVLSGHHSPALVFSVLAPSPCVHENPHQGLGDMPAHPTPCHHWYGSACVLCTLLRSRNSTEFFSFSCSFCFCPLDFFLMWF